MSADIHVSSITFHLPFDDAWEQLTNPLELPRLYPAWATRVQATDRAGVYSGVGPHGDEFTVVPRLDRQFGVIDFEVADPAGRVELSRSRLFPLKDGGCVLVHVATRWEGMDDVAWAQHRTNTDADLEHARRELEGTPPAADQAVQDRGS